MDTVVDVPHDGRMPNARERLDLRHEPLGCELRGHIGANELHRTWCAALQIGRAIDRSHPAGAGEDIEAILPRKDLPGLHGVVHASKRTQRESETCSLTLA